MTKSVLLLDKFWQEKRVWAQNGDVTEDGDKTVRVNGEHYVFAKDTGPFRGHGGREFTVKFTSGPHAGQTVTCNNVWHQGEIPEELKGLLPDNAEFVWNTEPLL